MTTLVVLGTGSGFKTLVGPGIGSGLKTIGGLGIGVGFDNSRWSRYWIRV